MKLSKIEICIIALTLAFVCFTGGFFAGRRKAVIITEYGTENPIRVEVSATLPPEDMDDNAESEQTEPQPDEIQSAQADVYTQSDEVRDEPVGTDTKLDMSEQSGEKINSASDTAEVSVSKAQNENSGKLNINTATHSELTELPGIGEVLAGRIIDYRTAHGAFSSITDIKKVSGIGDKRFEAIRDYIFTG